MRNIFAETQGLREGLERDQHIRTSNTHVDSESSELKIRHISDEIPSWDPYALFAARLTMT